MGFDVTFHPISKTELDYWLFDVVDNPDLAEQRAGEITEVSEQQQLVLELYRQFPEWLEEARNIDDSVFRQRERPLRRLKRRLRLVLGRYYSVGPTFGYTAATIAGYLHPYWYARGAALSFLYHVSPMILLFFKPLPALTHGRLSQILDPYQGLISENYCGSGFISAERLPAVEQYLEALRKRRRPSGKSALEEVFNDEALDALKQAFHYAKEHKLGLIEASDVVVPISDEYASDPDNLRAKFLEDIEDEFEGEEGDC